MLSDSYIDLGADREIRKEFREPRLKDKDLFEVVEEVFDRATVLAVLDLKRRKCIKILKGVVATGKEARVYWAKGFDGSDVAVKIYLTATAEFRKGIWKYLRGDPRYEWVASLPSHKLMAIWARKEFANLKKMHSVGVSVPEPLCVHRNVLVMRFVGENGIRAPLLKELHECGELNEETAKSIYAKLIDFVYKIYWDAELVHGDLSEYNVMVLQGEPYIIDVSQSVRVEHPNAIQFLYRDVQNVVKFFGNEVGIEVPDAEDLLSMVLEKRLRQSQV